MSESERDWNLAKLNAGLFEDDVLGELIRCGARAVQTAAGLTVDGLAGPATRAAVEDAIGKTIEGTGDHDGVRPTYQVPIPRRNAIESIYGTFRYKEHPDTPGAIIIEKDWVKANITRLELHTGQKVWVHRSIAFEMGELYKKACEVSGYTPAKVASWVPRHMRWDKSRSLSRHSWGIAFDIDWHLNGIGMSDTPLHRHPEWVEVFRGAGWNCGIDWRTYNDPMHFERTAR
tara:strand:+ start:352 stop:1044 length:693 start_codon:yes stop_codon:yes gene_type:complete